MRLVVIGNSGSGKSTLAERIGAVLRLPTHDLDHFYWYADGRKREEAEAKALVADVVVGAAWVIEGVYGWLADVALVRATALVWLDLSWTECREGLLRRGLRRGMTPSDQDALLAWASAYWTRDTPSSFAGHDRLYHAFDSEKTRLRTRAEVSATLAAAPSTCYMQRMAGTGTGAERVRRRRDKLRAAGLRPVQIWVPDTRAAGFAEECARQVRVIRDAETPESQAEDEAWFEVSDTAGWTA